MAIKAISQKNNGIGGFLVKYVVDTLNDLNEVPTNIAIGSEVLCVEDASRYILSPGKEWKKL